MRAFSAVLTNLKTAASPPSRYSVGTWLTMANLARSGAPPGRLAIRGKLKSRSVPVTETNPRAHSPSLWKEQVIKLRYWSERAHRRLSSRKSLKQSEFAVLMGKTPDGQDQFWGAPEFHRSVPPYFVSGLELAASYYHQGWPKQYGGARERGGGGAFRHTASPARTRVFCLAI